MEKVFPDPFYIPVICALGSLFYTLLSVLTDWGFDRSTNHLIFTTTFGLSVGLAAATNMIINHIDRKFAALNPTHTREGEDG